MIISQTPFRISFFGGGTDFPAFFKEHGGAVLTSTIDKYCYLSIHRLAPLFKHRFRASYSQTETVDNPQNFKHPLIRETLLWLKQEEGLEIAHTSDLPGQTGIGSSSAFTVGLLNAIHAFNGVNSTPNKLAQEAIHIERDRVGDPGGWQDQYEVAHGGLNHIEFKSNGSVKVNRLAVSAQRLMNFHRHLMLFFTGMDRNSFSILKEQTKRCKINEAALLSLKHMVGSAVDILAGKQSLNQFGDLLHEAWQIKRSLATGISNSEIDHVYTAACSAGARGGKLLGAGGRGFICLFVPPDKQETVRKALSSLAEVPFAFSAHGSRIIFSSDE